MTWDYWNHCCAKCRFFLSKTNGDMSNMKARATPGICSLKDVDKYPASYCLGKEGYEEKVINNECSSM